MYLPRPGEGGEFKPVPGGNYPAFCYQVIDLGTQNESFQGETKRLHKIRLTWEIKDDDCRMDDGRPMSISQKYTWSMHEKATLRKHLEAWRGLAFTDDDFGPTGFNIRDLLGKACMLQVTQKEGKNGKTYSNITAIANVPKQMRGNVGQLENPLLYFSIDEFDPDAFVKLSEYWQDVIKQSPEYQELQGGGGKRSAANKDQFGGMDDEVPF